METNVVRTVTGKQLVVLAIGLYIIYKFGKHQMANEIYLKASRKYSRELEEVLKEQNAEIKKLKKNVQPSLLPED